MRSFEDLVAQAQDTDVTGWDFSWLDGRATEERPPWGYARHLQSLYADAASALDLDTGGGEIVAAMPVLPARMAVTEAWGPNVLRSQAALGPRGVAVVRASTDRLPFADASFDLVTSRHPVKPAWSQIARVLREDGRYVAQHVGPASAFELIEVFLGPLPRARTARDPQNEMKDAVAAGLQITGLRTARCRMEFHDIGAVVWILRKCVWWVPDFSLERYLPQLRDLDASMRAGQPFVAHSSRTLIHARHPAG
ncbi:methyltransferase domain-containing protein [Kineosporia mesophila]|uniref:Methyltransferase domain-containing protein n=1 Tax=Kineosporia mesophila TaxID=566012 RepID=A0ABP6Z6W5_9ACTN|nr:class I SAM-dependent methyltransferase [Kineosporia mesophila]MCD5354820.1 class I SAM-dependent methyltransferase [Kineosporia mesophila]